MCILGFDEISISLDKILKQEAHGLNNYLNLIKVRPLFSLSQIA